MNGRRGFTLIELLIVVCIVGLLAGIAVPRFQRARSRALATNAVGSMRAIRIAVMIYFDSAAAWPAAGTLGAVPVDLAGYVPPNNPFSGTGWQLQWTQVTIVSGGTPIQVGSLALTTGDPAICPAASNLLGGPSSELSVLCGPTTGTVTQLIEP